MQPPPVFYYFCPSFIDIWPTIKFSLSLSLPLSLSHTLIGNLSLVHSLNLSVSSYQCDQIGRFIILSATFQSPWQQLFCPNCQHILGNFCKGDKIFYFTRKILLGNFYKHLTTFYWSHCFLPIFKQTDRDWFQRLREWKKEAERERKREVVIIIWDLFWN